MPSLTPIFDQVATEQGWSPDELGPKFSLEWFIWDGRMKVTAARMLRDPDAVIIPFPTARATAPRGR